VTKGAAALGDEALAEIFPIIHTYDNFPPAIDPFCEHDLGLFTWNGYELAWKIDYFDTDLTMYSPDPSDPTITTRVLAISLAEEL